MERALPGLAGRHRDHAGDVSALPGAAAAHRHVVGHQQVHQETAQPRLCRQQRAARLPLSCALQRAVGEYRCVLEFC